MTAEPIFKNRELHFVAESELAISLQSIEKVDAVLFTMWNDEVLEIEKWKPMLFPLFNKGVRYIACVGPFSEVLHDFIDELIYQYEEDHDPSVTDRVVTTFHWDETVADFCFFFTDLTITDENNGALIAVLDPKSIEDMKVQKCLI